MLQKLEKDQVQAELREKKMAAESKEFFMGQEDEDYKKLDAEMSRRRVSRMQREYEMLNYCFSASSILFKEI